MSLRPRSAKVDNCLVFIGTTARGLSDDERDALIDELCEHLPTLRAQYRLPVERERALPVRGLKPGVEFPRL